MATFSKKMMGKEVGDAKVYAKPHTMSGKVVKASDNPGSGPDHSKADTVNMSVGNISKAAGNPTGGSRDIQWGWNPVGGSSNFDVALTPNYLVATTFVGTVTVS